MIVWQCGVNPETDAAVFREAGKTIVDGGLVAFPTETVYGLGANGLDRNSVIRLFAVKKRPANDPVILHVFDADDALQLCTLTAHELPVVSRLQQAFWPGPLTLVVRAAPCIPKEVTANTEFVGIRCPSHPVARSLIEAAGVPIAGPSANPFGRISPTKAEHVMKYFGDSEDIAVLQAEDCCFVGIESTIIKIARSSESNEEDKTVLVEILRHGILTQQHIQGQLEPEFPHVQIINRCGRKAIADDEPETADTEAKDGPGMFLKHYAPSLPAYMLVSDESESISTVTLESIRQCALLDVGESFASLEPYASLYQAISFSSASELARQLFASLYDLDEAARKLDCSTIFIGVNEAVKNDPDFAGVMDRLYRAVAGKFRALESKTLPAT